ncbi:phenoloxidase-activating factor 3-like [Palaemon carinicauda]|uniref:phenoloxidase-activating factor 3-like n=1 Tax=Palaemon carinicauda TaxID=392227 RepID=UPI0035B695AE
MRIKIILWLIPYVFLPGNAQTPNAGCTTYDGRQGSCISILKCPPLRQLLVQISIGNAQFSELRRNICLLGREPYVCCVFDRSPIPSQPPPATSPTPSLQPGGADLLPEQCGIKGLEDRIVAGQPAPLGAWPWMVVLNGKINNRRTWHCGGTLISERYVLTAAHCIDPGFGIELDFVRVGEHTIGQDPDCDPFGRCAPRPQDIRVERIVKHPSYNKPCKDCNDITLLRLATPVVLHRRYVMPICLPLNPVEDMGFPIEELQGKAAWAAGWGTISQNPFITITPDILQQVLLPIQRLPFCQSITSSYPDQSMVLCAGGDGKDTCRGDSGGPLVVTNNFGSKYFLIGLTSKGPGACGSKDTQGVYTAIHHYVPWILSNLEP